MRIPPFYRFRSWQLIFFGAIIGAILSWLIFLYMYGEMQEKQVQTIRKQNEEIMDLRKEKKIWQEDFQKLNEKNQKLLTVQEIYIKVVNADKYKLDSLSVFEIEESIKEDISMVLAKDLSLVYSTRELLERTIENKPVKIKDKRYKLQVKNMVFYTLLTIEVEIGLAE